MRRILNLIAISLALSASVGFADTFQYVTQLNRFNDAWLAVFRNNPDVDKINIKLRKQLDAVLANPDTLIKAAADVTHIPADRFSVVDFNRYSQTRTHDSGGKVEIAIRVDPIVGNSTVTISLAFPGSSIEKKDAQPIVEHYCDAISPELKKISQQFFDTNFPPVLEAAEKQRKDVEESLNNREADRQNLQYKSYQLLPYEKVSEHMADLQRQQLAIRLSLAGMKARETALQEQIAKAQARLRQQADESKKEASSDDLIRSLSDLVKLRSDQAAKTRQSSQAGVATQAEASDAEAKVLEAKIELYAAQAKKQPHLNSDQLDSLNTELTKLAIDQAEAEARLKFLEDVNHEVTERIERRVQLDQEIKRVDEEIERQKDKRTRATSRVKELETIKANFKPIEWTFSDN